MAGVSLTIFKMVTFGGQLVLRPVERPALCQVTDPEQGETP